MTDLKFTPEDFGGDGKLKTAEFVSPEQAAKLANARLAEILEGAPKVRSTISLRRVQRIHIDPPISGKFRAKLVCIEEVRK